MTEAEQRADCPKCKQRNILVKDGRLLVHNLPQRVPEPKELEAMGGLFTFVKLDHTELPRPS